MDKRCQCGHRPAIHVAGAHGVEWCKGAGCPCDHFELKPVIEQGTVFPGVTARAAECGTALERLELDAWQRRMFPPEARVPFVSPIESTVTVIRERFERELGITDLSAWRVVTTPAVLERVGRDVLEDFARGLGTSLAIEWPTAVLQADGAP